MNVNARRVPMAGCQRRIAILWLVGSGLFMSILALQTILGKFGQRKGDAWLWATPLILPSALLIVGSVMYEIRAAQSTDTCERFPYRVCLGLSAVYIFGLIAVPLTQPFTTWTALELMDISKFWLLPLQGLTSISLGAFFRSASRQG